MVASPPSRVSCRSRCRCFAFDRHARDVTKSRDAGAHLGGLTPGSVRHDERDWALRCREPRDGDRVRVGKQKQWLRRSVPGERRHGGRFMAAKDGLAIRQALDRQAPGVRRLSLLAPMNHQDEARAGRNARDQRAHAEAGMDAATRAACVGVVSAAHRSSRLSSMARLYTDGDQAPVQPSRADLLHRGDAVSTFLSARAAVLDCWACTSFSLPALRA
jgi:hypothetical protein